MILRSWNGRHTLLDHPVPRCWVRERIALLGDACHAMLPYEQSRQNGNAYHRSSPAGRVLRDLALIAKGRRGGDRFLRRLEWLYDFDPTNQVLAAAS
jgi:hypothetical protein